MPENEFPPEPSGAPLPRDPDQRAALESAEPSASQTLAALPAQQAPAPHELPRPRGIAPLWHALILVIGVLAFSLWGAVHKDSNPFLPTQPSAAVHGQAPAQSQGVDSVRIIRYALTGLLELALVAWVALGLRLRRTPFRSLFGEWPHALNDFTREGLVAAAFWISSMLILVALALTWLLVETQIEKHHHAAEAQHASQSQPGAAKTKALSEKAPDEKQLDLIRELTELAPANGIEIACWGALCVIVGFSEEILFRGYLQTQSIALLRNVPVALVFTAIIFGLAHGYQGIRGMVLISVYGVLFGIVARMRRNLFPVMLAHSWHDFFTGMMLALVRSSGILDHLLRPH